MEGTGRSAGVARDLTTTRSIDRDDATTAARRADIGATLEAVAAELRGQWSSALDRGDFDEVTRLVEASHAVQRAIVALEDDRVIASFTNPS